MVLKNTWALGEDYEHTDQNAVATQVNQNEADIAALAAGKQPLDADLTAIAALVSGADKVPYATGSGAWALATLTAAGRALIDDADAAAQRTTLGLAIGTNVQAYDAELAALAGLVSAANKMPYFTGAGTASLADLTSFARSILDDTDAAGVRATIGAQSSADVASAISTAINNLIASAPGTLDTLDELAAALGDDPNFASTITTALAGKQPLDSDLTAIAALTSAANKMPYATGAGTWSLTDLTAAGRALLDDADAAAQRTTLGLGSAATHAHSEYQPAGSYQTAGSATGLPADFMLVQVGNTARAVGSGDFAVGHRIGRACTITSVIYQFDTADASGSTAVELRRNGAQVASSNLTVTAANQADGTGTDAARTATISQSFSAGDRLNLQITSVGTTPGKGLRAWLVGTWN